MDRVKSINKLPEGWIQTTIGEIAVISSGGTPILANSKYFRGNIPWVKSGVSFPELSDTPLSNYKCKVFIELL